MTLEEAQEYWAGPPSVPSDQEFALTLGRIRERRPELEDLCLSIACGLREERRRGPASLPWYPTDRSPSRIGLYSCPARDGARVICERCVGRMVGPVGGARYRSCRLRPLSRLDVALQGDGTMPVLVACDSCNTAIGVR